MGQTQRPENCAVEVSHDHGWNPDPSSISKIEGKPVSADGIGPSRRKDLSMYDDVHQKSQMFEVSPTYANVRYRRGTRLKVVQ